MPASSFLKLDKNRESALVVALLAAFTLASLLINLVRHYSFNSQWYDFGIFDEVVWKFSRFQTPIIAPKGYIHVFGDHFSPSIISLAPLYWLTNGQWIIYLAQTLFVVAAAWFLYQIARREVKSILVRLSLLFSFLFFAGLQNALFTDVHYMVFAVLPLSLMLYALYFQKNGLYWFSLIYFLGWKENAAGIALGLSAFLFFKKKNKFFALATAAISLAWGIVAMKVVIPFFAGGIYPYSPEWPRSLNEFINAFFQPAIKTKTLLISFSSFSFLPLLYPPLWPAIAEQYIERFVLNPTGTRWNIGMHYNAILTPLFFISSLEIAKRIINRFSRFAAPLISVALILGTAYNSYKVSPSPMLLSVRPVYYRQLEQNNHYQAFLRKIPTDKGLIMTNNNLAAHLTHYPVTLLQHDYYKHDPAVVAVYTIKGQNVNNYYPLKFEELHLFIGELQNDKQYQELEGIDNGYIFIKKQASAPTF